MTVDAYEQTLASNLQSSTRARPQWPKPVRRAYIPKSDGGRRSLGIPALEDKIVQGAVAEVLNAVYEADFVDFSHGFRPGRSSHLEHAEGTTDRQIELWTRHRAANRGRATATDA